MNRKQKIIVSITGIFIVFLALVGLTYAYFLTRITGNENDKSISVTTANLELIYSDETSDLITSDKPIVPGFEDTKTFKVTNKGQYTDYVVVLENMNTTYANDGTIIDEEGKQADVTKGQATTFASNDFVYTLTCKKKDGTDCNGQNNQISLPLKDAVLLKNEIDEGDEHTYILTVWYLETGKNQSSDMNKTIQGRVNIYDSKLFLKDLSKIAPTVLSNLSADNIVQSNRASTQSFFYIPVISGKTFEIINNSEDYKIAVGGYIEKEIYNDFTYRINYDSSWVLAGKSKTEIITADYLRINVTSNDGNIADINNIDLSEFIVKYSDSEENLLTKLSSLENAFNSYSLKDYDGTELTEWLDDNLISYSHSNLEYDESMSNTIKYFESIVADGRWNGVEFDIQISKDNEFVLYHDPAIEEQYIKDLTVAELKALKSDIITLEEGVNYLKDKGLLLALDVKTFPDSEELAEKLFTIIETYGLNNKLRFCNCPDTLIKYIPDNYNNYTYVRYDWDKEDAPKFNNSNIGDNKVYYANNVQYMNYEKLVNILKSGHKKIAVWDYDENRFDDYDFIMNLAVISYLCKSYGAELLITPYHYPDFDFSGIRETDILKFVRKDIWDASGLIQYK